MPIVSIMTARRPLSSPAHSQPVVNPSLVITLAGLTPSAISCFGSSWNRTPAIDSLAADGVCWDRVVCHTTDPMEVWLHWFQACVSLNPESRHVLITDDSALVTAVRSSRFSDRCEVQEQADHPFGTNPIPANARPAETIDDSRIAALFRMAQDGLADQKSPDTVWLHSRALLECWDAPRELFPIDDVLVDELDEPDDAVAPVDAPRDQPTCAAIFDTVTPPQHEITEADDIDLAMAWMRTYGCQVRLIDHLLDDLIELAEQSDIPLILAGTSGFALGQNGFIGHAAGPLRSCHIAVPVVTNRGGPLRLRAVTGTDSVASLLPHIASDRDDWLDASLWASQNQATNDADAGSPLVTTTADQVHQCVNTPEWFYVRDLQDEDALFLKPDDVHDANNVARLKRGVVDAFREKGT